VYHKKRASEHYIIAFVSSRCDIIMNKTGLSAKTNGMIGGNAPSSYLPKLQKQAGIYLQCEII
jgi:hypothetical protein